MSNAIDRATLMGYSEVALRLGLTPASIRQFVHRGFLHSIAIDGETHKYILRAEVEWYDLKRRGKETTPNPYFHWLAASSLAELPATTLAASISELFADSAIPKAAAVVVLLALVLLLLRGETDAKTRALMLAALAALGVLAVAALYSERMVSTREKQRLEQLARDVSNPDAFVEELGRYLAPAS